MTKDFNKILKNLSIEGVQIDTFDHPNKAEKSTDKLENATTKIVTPPTKPSTKGRRKKKPVTPVTSGRRFRGKDYTTTRIRKDLMTLLRLLFDDKNNIEIIEILILQYLEQNQKLLTKKFTSINH